MKTIHSRRENRDCRDDPGLPSPAAYIALSQLQNGGMVRKECHRTSTRTSWAEDHIAIAGILAIGNSKPCALLGSFGSDFWVTEWGYPPIGIYFADCPSAGHDMVCLDYRAAGRRVSLRLFMWIRNAITQSLISQTPSSPSFAALSRARTLTDTTLKPSPNFAVAASCARQLNSHYRSTQDARIDHYGCIAWVDFGCRFP
jgi:hypothetical protein